MLSYIDFEVDVATMLKKILDQINTFEFSKVMYYIFIAGNQRKKTSKSQNIGDTLRRNYL